jgi:hypothetical protein
MSAYLTVAEASEYFNERLNSETWFDATAPKQLQALLTATRYINNLNFEYEKTDSTQENAFPRNDETEVPVAIQQACCEIAIALLDGVDIEAEYSNLDMVSQGYGSVKSTYDRSSKPLHIIAWIPSIVAWKLLLPYMVDQMSVTISRV